MITHMEVIAVIFSGISPGFRHFTLFPPPFPSKQRCFKGARSERARPRRGGEVGEAFGIRVRITAALQNHSLPSGIV